MLPALRDYDPPHDADDDRVCGNCRRAYRDALWFPIFNSETGVYHSGGEYGITDCGRDATGDRYLWPL